MINESEINNSESAVPATGQMSEMPEPISEPKEEIKEEIKQETIKEETKPDESEIDIFSMMSQPTDKDILQAETKKKIESGEIVAPVKEPAKAVELDNHKLVASLTISAVSVGLGMLLQVLSGDWSDEGEKRYTLSASRKAQLLEPLEALLLASKKKYNPMVVLVVTIFITYIPMTINAFRFRKETEAAKRKKVLDALIKKERAETGLPNLEVEEENYFVKEETKEKEPDLSEAVKEKEKADQIIQDEIKRIKTKIGARSKADREFLLKHDLKQKK